MSQGDEDLGGMESASGDGFLDDSQAAGVAVFVAEPLEDAAGGMSLLPRGLLVVVEDLVDDGQERIELGPGAWDRAAVARRFGMLEDLLEGIPVDVVRAAGSCACSGRQRERDGGSRPRSPCRCTPIDLTTGEPRWG